MYGDLNLDLLDLSKVESCVDRVNMFIYLTNVYGAPKESELIDKFIDIFYDIIRNGNFRTSNKNDLNYLWNLTYNDAICYHKAAYENFGWYFYRQLSLDSRGMSREELKDYILNFKESGLSKSLLRDFKKDNEDYEIKRMMERYRYYRPFKEKIIKAYLLNRMLELDLHSNTLRYENKNYNNIVDAVSTILSEQKVECNLSNYKKALADGYYMYKKNKFGLDNLYKIVHRCSTHDIIGKFHIKFNDKEIFVPEDKAEEMINGLSDELFNLSTKFLDIYCTNGVLLLKIRDRLMKSPLMIKEFRDPKERLKYILENQLYALTSSKLARAITIRTLYGKLVDSDNIRYNKDGDIQEEFNDMLFDVVVGNPPYNNGMDLDFVKLGYNLSTQYCCMITPAKWQTAEANQSIASEMSYGQFREEMVPHMRYVCFYPTCKDVFDIYQTDGITWYILDKDLHDTCIVENRCNDIKYFNSVENRTIINCESLLNIGNEIIQYLGKYNKYKFMDIEHDSKYEVWMNTKVSGYDWYATKSPRYVLSTSVLVGSHQQVEGEKKCIFESNSIDECKSFMTWIYSKFTRFFLVPNISKLNNIQTNYCFRFVPAPAILDEHGNRVEGKFDHTYTDKELYKTFKLPQKYIDVIEAVIKERKID